MRIPYDPQGPAGRVAVMVRLLWTLSRYRPMAATAMASHTAGTTRLPMKSPAMGTSRIYSAVKKPALPVVV